LREYPGRIGGTEDGESIYWDEETHRKKRSDMGPFTYAAQILLNPAADSAQGFKREWLRYYTSIKKYDKMNNYILVDSASSKKKGSDYTAMIVVGLGSDGNYYILDMVRDRLNLAERLDRLFELHRKYKPKQVRFERYGMLSDLDAIRGRQEQENYRFDVKEVAGRISKVDRVRRLIPLFEQGKVWLPKSLHVTDWQHISVDLVRALVEEEFLAFPSGVHDDMMDALSRICEPELRLSWPMEKKASDPTPQRRTENSRVAWMA
jgi:predicted phage terminase large subunit-like protein